MDMNPHYPKAVWGFNGTERPGAVYLAAVLAAHAQKGLPAFGIYGHDVQDLDVEHYTPTVYFDFGSYLHVLCGDDVETYTEGTKLLDKLVPYKGTTGMIYSGAGNKPLKLKEYSGLTISDPSQNSSAINTKKQTAWWKATH